MKTETQQIAGLTPTVTLNQQYTAGNRTQLAVVLGAVGSGAYHDFVNDYSYMSDPATNPFGQMTAVTQHAFDGTLPSGNVADVMAPKYVTLHYDRTGEFTTVSRYAGT